MLRIILDWYSRQTLQTDPLAFPAGTRWFSEAQLPSPFEPRLRGDPLGEARSHADGVIGHFTIGDASKAGLNLKADATCFVVLEAKLSSGLSANVSNAKGYNQAARLVACMAEALFRAARSASGLSPRSASDQKALYPNSRSRPHSGCGAHARANL